MEPIDFHGSNTVYAKDQPQYLPLPAHLDHSTGTVTSCWKPSFYERLSVLFGANIFLSQLTFNDPLQPQRPYVGRRFCDASGEYSYE